MCVTTTKGGDLFQVAPETGCAFVSTGTTTYWPTDTNKIPDVIYFFITRKISRNFIEIEARSSSDHSPIYLTISKTVIKKELNLKLYNKNTDWTSFK